jgi:ABC-type multidrug transport system ATPase subunit
MTPSPIRTVPPPPPAPGPGLSVTLAEATRSVRVRTLLDRVTLHLPAGEFVGVVGASGSGKSTLVKALAGLMKLTSGEVRFNNVPCSAEQLRTDRRVAYLPQDVIVHEPLTPAEAIGYAAKLRGLGSPTSEQIHAALERVGMKERAAVPIERLSGGQRKRIALAIELLGDPGLILLDEATSGLDPATEGDMMSLFRSLADEGRTVLCVTHSPARLQQCDRILVMAEGACVFHGPPALAPAFFGVRSLEALYTALAASPADVWQKKFFTANAARLAIPPSASAPALVETIASAPALSQTVVLTTRYGRLQLSDFRAVLLQLAQAPAIGLMVGATFGDIRSRFAEQHAADSRQVLFVLVVAVLWCAGAASAREVVKELAVIRHESRFGLDLRSYFASKLAILGALALLQATILLLMVRWLSHLTGPLETQLVVVGLTALAGVALGLLVSSSVGTSERAMTLLPIALIGLAVFSSGLARLSGPALWTARLLSPAYWSLDGLKAPLASSLRNATYPGAPGEFQPPILGSGGPVWLDLAALSVQAALMLTLAWLALRTRLKS